MVVFFVWTEGLSVVKNRSVASAMSALVGVSVMKLVSEKEDVSVVWGESVGESSFVPEMRSESVWSMCSVPAGLAVTER